MTVGTLPCLSPANFLHLHSKTELDTVGKELENYTVSNGNIE